MLKPKPSWLQRVTPSSAWVTIAPHIYYPDHVKDPTLYPDIIAHEEVHIKQQEAMGLTVWMTRYFGDRLFRMDQECQAAAAQIHEDPTTKEWVIRGFETMLNSSTYFYCDVTPEMIRASIENYLSLYHTCAEDLTKKWAKYYATLPLIDYSKYYGEWSYEPTPMLQPIADAPLNDSDFFYEGYVYPSTPSNNIGRRANEDGQDSSKTSSYNPWYKDPFSTEKFLDRY